MSDTQRVLPAHVYDALQLSAEMYGGIGGGQWFADGMTSGRIPYCYMGHLVCAGVERRESALMPFEAFGISYTNNDCAVIDINQRLSRSRCIDRVTFEEWCAELNVVRGPEEPSPESSCDGGNSSEVLATVAA